MLEEFQAYLPLVVFLWTVITFALGHFIGHRTAIKRDKRKEFNQIAEAIREKLRWQIRLIEDNCYPSGEALLTDKEFDSFIDVCDKKERVRLISLYQNYKKTLQECILRDEYNFCTFVNHDSLKSAIKKLLPFTERH